MCIIILLPIQMLLDANNFIRASVCATSKLQVLCLEQIEI